MKKSLVIVLALALVAGAWRRPSPSRRRPPASHPREDRPSGTLTIGTRTGSPPFAYVNARTSG